MKYKLKENDYDDAKACMNEAERIGLTRRMGYHAWCAGQGANGYTSILAFFDDILECIKTSNPTNTKTNKDLEVSATPTPKVCPVCKSNNLKLMLKDGFRCLDCNSQGHLGKHSLKS